LTRVKTIPEFVSYSAYFFRDPESYEAAALAKHWKDPHVRVWLEQFVNALEQLPLFAATEIENCLRTVAEKSGIAAAKLIHPTRLALTGFGVSPGLFETMAVLGKETVVRRLRRAILKISAH
jgi:glutamyl-tRNA synthetase